MGNGKNMLSPFVMQPTPWLGWMGEVQKSSGMLPSVANPRLRGM